MRGSLALLIRSLRVDARLMRSHLFRLLFVGLIYFALISARSTSIYFGAPGLMFFQSIAWLNVIIVTVAGVSFFATVITEEKEEQTLGLLRMAGINPLGLLLGKAVPRLVAAVVLLSVQLPFTFLAITLGGVTMTQVLAVYAALTAYTVMLSGLGLVCSVVCRTSRSACWLMSVVVFVLLVLPYWIAGIFMFGGGAGLLGGLVASANSLLLRISPFPRASTILQTGFDESPWSEQVVGDVVLAAVLYAAAWWLFAVLVRYDEAGGGGRGLLFRRTSRLRRLGVSRAWANALAWKDFHFLSGGKPMLIGKAVFYGMLLGGLVAFVQTLFGGRQMSLEDVGGLVMSVMLIALSVETALCASRIFHAEVRGRTLSDLMMLPQTPAGIAWSKGTGCLLSFVPAAGYFVVGAVIYPDGVRDFLDEALAEPVFWFMIVQYGFFLHLVALLSLVLKWGALPLAFVLVYPVGWFLISMLMIGSGASGANAFFGLMAFLGVFAVVGMHVAVLARMKDAAAQ